MKELSNGIFVEEIGKKKIFLTKNLIPRESVYGERLIGEYRVIEQSKSKLGALLAKTNGKTVLDVKNGSIVLYLGASTGTTVSHFSDIVGNEGGIFAIEIAPRVMRELVFLAEERKNIAPILADANHPEEYKDKIMRVDLLYQDVSQKNQVEIFLKNSKMFLKKEGTAIICLKAKSISSVKEPKTVYEESEMVISKELKIIDKISIEQYHKGHCVFVCIKK